MLPAQKSDFRVDRSKKRLNGKKQGCCKKTQMILQQPHIVFRFYKPSNLTAFSLAILLKTVWLILPSASSFFRKFIKPT